MVLRLHVGLSPILLGAGDVALHHIHAIILVLPHGSAREVLRAAARRVQVVAAAVGQRAVVVGALGVSHGQQRPQPDEGQ